jgi:gamma-glutamylcyclotransferase (GGCT)/AIG2-like uncharacterized protein YtfP
MTEMWDALDLERPERPYFVYGTLRPELGNAHWWRSCGAQAFYDGEAKVYGFKLVAKGIPYAVLAEDHDVVVGALILPPEDLEDQVYLRWSLDSLEGYPLHYDRLVTRVWTPDGSCMAWIYSPTNYKPTGPVVASGDFYEHRKEAR